MEELVGTYKATRYRNQEMNFWVGFSEAGEQITGTVEEGIPEQGKMYRFFGHWKNSPKYGRQFKVTIFTEHEPHNREAVMAYLKKHCKGTGIGEVGIVKIWDAYGSESIRTMRTQPRQVAEQLGFDEEKCIAVSARLAEYRKTENTAIDLMGLFAGRGFPASTIRAAIDKWGSLAPAIVRRDPFALMTNSLPGCGFARCDALYMSLGLDPTKLKRQTLCAWNHLVTVSSGDTWFPVAVGVEGIRLKIGSADVQPIKALKLGLRSRWLSKYVDSEGGKWIGDHDKTEDEATVAACVDRLSGSAATWPAVGAGRLSPHQAEELAKATAAPFGILSGTPGTGKTYTAAALIRAIIAEHGEGAITCIAPTGKAGVRLTESLAKAGAPVQAMTVHRALKPMQNGHGTGMSGWGFAHNEKNPLPAKFVIVDESSMLDTSLMACLLRACATGTRVLLIGDPNQLPPVGHGAPLRDLIAAGVCHGQLSEIQRNSGLIVEGCRSIRRGKRIHTCPRFDDQGNNLRIALASSPAQVVEMIRRVFAAVSAKGERDPIEEIQILIGLNDQGDLSRKKLNPLIQDILNPHGARVDGVAFRGGDKIICTGNGWYPVDGEKANVTEFLANGEIGRITSIDKLAFVAEFASVGEGTRRIRIPLKTEYAKSFELAYAITCHKSQGSEWPVVVIVADDAAYRVCSREWWYTAVSRAKDRCLILGRLGTIEKQCQRVSLEKRKTFLAERVMELKAKRTEPCERASEPRSEPDSLSLPSPLSETPASNIHSSSLV